MVYFFVFQSASRVKDEAGGVPIQLRQFLSRSTLARQGNPFKQWEVLKSEYPHLYVLALKHEPAIALSVPAERLFSKAGLVAFDLRSRLISAHLIQILFLSSIPKTLWYGGV